MDDRTGRHVVCSQRASQTLFSRDCKNVILEEANHDRTVRPVVCSQQAHQFVIEDDETESEFVVKIQNILAQCEWSSAKKAKTILNRCNKRQRQTFYNMEKVYVFNIASICTHGEELLRQLAFHQEYKRSHNETDVRHICEIGVRTRWDLWRENNLTGKTLHGNTCLWLVMNKSSVSRAQKSTYSQILYCVLVRWTRTLIQILHGKTSWRGSQFTRIQRFGQDWWWANGTRKEHFPKIHHFAAQPQNPRAVGKIERNTREFDKKDHLHVYVQRHLMRVKRQQDGMRVKCSTRFSLCKKIRSKTMVIPRT